jgi:large subunit ribosomal protein L23
MKRAEDVVIRPHITEKSNDEAAYGKYTFIVNAKSTKTEIKSAVEKLFNVRVLKVSTANYKGKIKRLGVHVGKRPDWKKAVVSIDTNPEVATYLAEGGKTLSTNRKYKSRIDEFGYTQ